MKIIYVALLELDIHNAIRTHVLEICAHFQKAGHDVTLVAPKPWREKPEFPFKTFYVPFFGFSFLRLWLFNIVLCLHLKKMLSFEKPDCVYIRELLNPLPALLLKFLRIPYFVECNDFMLKTPHCVNHPLKSFYVKGCEKIEIGNARALFMPAEGIKKDMIKTYGFDENKMHVVGNGANTDLFYPKNMAECRKKLNFPSDVFLLGYAGSFQDYHDLETAIIPLVQLKEKIKNIKLLLIGKGMGREKKYEELINKLSLQDRALFTGQIPYDQVPLYLNSCDVLFVTFKKIRLEQILTVKLKEYMACGRPVIATEIPQSPFFKKYPDAVYAIPPEDPQRFADAVIELYRNDEKRKKIGRAAYEVVKTQYTWENVAKQTLNIMGKFIK